MEENFKKTNLAYDVNERPPLWIIAVVALQHIMIMYNEVILFPVIIGKAGGAPVDHIRYACFAAAVVAGLATLIQVLRLGPVGSGYVIFMGSSTVYLACSTEAVKLGGFALMASLTLLTVPVQFIMAYFLRHLRHIITSTVGGVVILLIVLTLLPVSLHEWVGAKDSPDYGSYQSFCTGFITLFSFVCLSLFGNRHLKIWAPVISMALGMLSAHFFGIFYLTHTRTAPWFGLPQGSWPGLATNLGWNHFPLFAAFVLATIVNTMMSIGNAMAVQPISHRDFKKIDYARVQGCLYADGIGNILSGLAGTTPNETYSENIPVVKLTGVASRAVGVGGAVTLILFAFCPKAGALIVDMPGAVEGGFLVGILAMMIHSGLGLIITAGLNHHTGILVGTSLCLGIMAETKDFFPTVLPLALKTLFNNAVAVGGLNALILSTIFHCMPKPRLRFGVKPVVSQLRPSLKRIAEWAGSQDFSSRGVDRLQLACEEVFMHISHEFQRKDIASRVVFGLSREEEGIIVEIKGREKIEDVDQTDKMPNLRQSSQAELATLGLYLLGKIANEVKHTIISGHTYISFIVCDD
ncbi:MAG: hypothetical protein HQK56_04490 [Deltaproteobacteria bacterium]|nr:hypothetical protein [Deltaproteobacteria bacterium]